MKFPRHNTEKEFNEFKRIALIDLADKLNIENNSRDLEEKVKKANESIFTKLEAYFDAYNKRNTHIPTDLSTNYNELISNLEKTCSIYMTALQSL